MIQADINALEITLAHLPVDLKKHFADHSWYKTFSKDQGIAHHRLITLDNQRVMGKEYHIQNVNSYISRLKGWMARFHGVGTAYLPSYLA